jgi:catechol 2,3-dioxygenase-like lactoylglutathione lyase family enzyme
MITSLHHVAILTRDMDSALEFYTELLGCQIPRVIEIDRPGLKLKSAMLPIGPSGKTYLQILEPGLGPGVGELEKGGEGTIFEVGYQVDDLEAFNEEMIDRGVSPVDLSGHPISGKFIVSKFGNRYSFLPKDKTRGTRSEFVQVMEQD